MGGSKIVLATVGVLAMVVSAGDGRARAQAVGFGPVIGAVPDGVGTNVSPVATANRRHVRLGVNAASTDVLGFNSVPVSGAVGGGGLGGGFGGFRTFGAVGPAAVGAGVVGFPAYGYGYGYGYPGYGYGYPGYGYRTPYPYSSGYLGGGLGGAPTVPPLGARTTNSLGPLMNGIMGSTRGGWRR